MENIELQNIWKSHDQKLEDMLAINKEIAVSVSKLKLDKQINRLYLPKWTALIIGIPYTAILIVITFIAFTAEAYLVTLGFGAIALIMTTILFAYVYQLYLIGKIKRDEGVLSTQKTLSQLRISSSKSLHRAIFQLPFWSICWISIDGLVENPVVYGGVNLIVFMALSYLSYWIYKKLNNVNGSSRIREFFYSGNEWDPIFKSAEILDQIKEYQK
ncbi:hypothetical protein BST97_05930 [Nonlabens spongiae]|uniref:Uncharacterized protein n=1 Tax=Nonlabens spongiae TaxID=331648 RepID=A0A1W6MIW9_9FLAO|nr:hypothetical protein [Nonlabens spongiae]ARN77564.1 hypothetical protein BST97_05930 [Nonlabens spongiae]